MNEMIVEKILVGNLKTVGEKNSNHPMNREWTSGIFKEPVKDPVWLGKTKLTGDEQADLKNHGGLEKAVFVYPIQHYLKWQEELMIENMNIGAMGENFALSGQLEENACIGDCYKIGEAVVQISQPRQPCWKPARRFQIKDLALRLQNSGRTGWYLRVIKEGYVKEGQRLQLLERPYPQWTIAKCNEVMHKKKKDLKAVTELASCEYLAQSWRKTLHAIVEKGENPNVEKRVYGPNI
ncbi:MOSC domain-containing protein YiiM [Evansella caseinilytica]|uniref:MOSC domain-containing protein YiiM n=1 Tax=Evansella caseinilytica TaxID=1503961 RepID=A0A1H3SH79_9BACI|nr:MOSC domain-containing protein [Evansella caseinilytica]SDZ37322.1 MOSC domain-containing protein YiiM [Evansella caseinilytica]